MMAGGMIGRRGIVARRIRRVIGGRYPDPDPRGYRKSNARIGLPEFRFRISVSRFGIRDSEFAIRNSRFDFRESDFANPVSRTRLGLIGAIEPAIETNTST